jgi:membrane protease YdiL (CAAX protease family)
MRDAPRRPARFLVVTLLASTPVGVLALLDAVPALPGGLPLGSLVLVLVPGAVASVLHHRDTGVRPLPALAAALGARRVGPGGWALAVAVPLAAVALGAQLSTWTGAGVAGDAPGGAAAVGLLVLFLVAAVPEELGWSTYATHGLLRRHGVLTVGLVVGTSWALFHGASWVAMSYPPAWIAGQVGFDLALRTFMVLLYATRGQSLALACTIHAVANVATLFPAGWDGVNPAYAALPLAALTAAVGRPPRRQAGTPRPNRSGIGSAPKAGRNERR